MMTVSVRFTLYSIFPPFFFHFSHLFDRFASPFVSFWSFIFFHFFYFPNFLFFLCSAFDSVVLLLFRNCLLFIVLLLSFFSFMKSSVAYWLCQEFMASPPPTLTSDHTYVWALPSCPANWAGVYKAAGDAAPRPRAAVGAAPRTRCQGGRWSAPRSQHPAAEDVSHAPRLCGQCRHPLCTPPPCGR